MTTTRTRTYRVLRLGGYAVTCIPVIQVAVFLATNPVGAMVCFFLPPLLASLFVLADNGRFNRTAVRAAWLLLSVNAAVALMAELDVLPIQPQFAGLLPPRIDRVLVLYLAGWYSFILIVCPAWYVYWRVFDNSCPYRVGVRLIAGSLLWTFAVGAFATLAGRKLF